jgi:hypothetical protein
MTTLRPLRTVVRPRAVLALTLLLLAQFVGIGVLLPYYAFTHPNTDEFRVFAIGLALFACVTTYGVWFQRPWAMWTTLWLVSFKLVVDLFNYALNLDRALLPLSELINTGILVLVFRLPFPSSARITVGQRLFFAFVLVLAAWVGLWGMFLPASIARVLPFEVPPLHARFLGAMYLSGVAFMALGILAREWAEVRVVVPMIATWTGMLGVVSLSHLEAFSWARIQVWIWFVAYIAYPIIAAWIAWKQRARREPASGPANSSALRRYLAVQGAIVTLLALSLLLAPSFMTTIWPWAITPLLAQIYSAPFLSYGLGSLYAARQQRWAEVRIVVWATLVFSLGVLIASLLHAKLFNLAGPSAWLWFGGFGMATLALALFGLAPVLRVAPQVRSVATPIDD